MSTTGHQGILATVLCNTHTSRAKLQLQVCAADVPAPAAAPAATVNRSHSQPGCCSSCVLHYTEDTAAAYYVTSSHTCFFGCSTRCVHGAIPTCTIRMAVRQEGTRQLHILTWLHILAAHRLGCACIQPRCHQMGVCCLTTHTCVRRYNRWSRAYKVLIQKHIECLDAV